MRPQSLELQDLRIRDLEAEVKRLVGMIPNPAVMKAEAALVAKAEIAKVLAPNIVASLEPVMDEVISLERKLDLTLGQVGADARKAHDAAVSVGTSAADMLLSLTHHFCYGVSHE